MSNHVMVSNNMFHFVIQGLGSSSHVEAWVTIVFRSLILLLLGLGSGHLYGRHTEEHVAETFEKVGVGDWLDGLFVKKSIKEHYFEGLGLFKEKKEKKELNISRL